MVAGCADLQGRCFDRTKKFSAQRQRVELGFEARTETKRVVLTPLPCWQGHSSANRRTLIDEMIRDILFSGSLLI